MAHQIPHMLLRLGSVILLLATAACNEDIEPFAPEHADLHFSLWGYLDASADTQWIRVTPVRQSIFTEPGELDAIVTLEHLESGETHVLNDSVFQFPAFGLERGADAYVHNFWTDAPIEFGQTYRLSVVGSEGASTSATARIPEDIESINMGIGNRGWVRVNNAEHLAMVVLREYLVDDPDECTPTWPRILTVNAWPLSKLGPESWEAEIPSRFRRPPCRVVANDILVVASGVEWIPEGIAFSVSAPTAYGFPSSVEDGLGYLAGVVSKVVPFEECWIENPFTGARGDGCVLTYLDGKTAALRGTITAAVCGGGPAVRVEIRLREIPDDPGQRVLVRRVFSDADGFYRMEAIDPEKTYELLLAHVLFDTTLFVPQDTLQFEPKDEVTFDLALGPEHQRVSCGDP